MSFHVTEIYEFEGFRLDVGERLLERKGKRIDLTDRAFDVLCVLVRNSGRLVSKDQLLEEVWPDAFVEENSINKNVSLLRKSLGIGRSDAKFIETVRGRGFRFVAKVTEVEEVKAPAEIKGPVTAPKMAVAEAPAPVERYSERQRGNVVALVDWRQKPEIGLEEAAAENVDSPRQPVRVRGRSYLFIGAIAAVFLFGLIAVVYLASREQPAAPSNESIRTIAVLPFKPMLNESRDEAFEMGMADTLISKLSASRQMTVRPLSAVRRYGSIDSDELAAGRALGVDAVLGGSIQRSNDKVRINVRLVRVSDGMALWSGTFDENLTDIFSIQDAISQKVVSALDVPLNADEEIQLAKRYTRNPEAYEYYLRGKTHYFRITLPELEKAAELFQKAIDADPNYALAYAWLAEAYRTQSIATHADARTVNPVAKEYAVKALELDETLPDAHIALAWIHLFYDWDWAATDREARRAIELAPNNSDAHRVYAHLLSVTGRHEEAIAEGRRARELAPLTLITASLEGQFLMFAGRLDEAEDRLKKTLETDPNFWITLNALAKVYFLQGRYNEAIETIRKARATSSGSNAPVGQLGYMLAKTGSTAEALKLLDEIKSKQKDSVVTMYYLALINNGLGEKEAALDALEKAFEQRESAMAFLMVDPGWDPLRGEPRFQAIMQKMNLQKA